MNFYQAQESARKQSKRLVLLFVLAVVTLLVLTNVLLICLAWFSDLRNVVFAAGIDVSALPWYKALLVIIDGFGLEKIIIVSLIISSVIGVATWSKWSSLSHGGQVIADTLGGIQVNPDSKDPRERRLLNVVEEMALASSMAVPSVYVLKQEKGVNAFAAGISTDDAVVAVSQGAMEQLNREQLQGVVAHEFSHILNGDMRLNVRIVATLHGLLMINETGRLLIDIGWRSGRSYTSSRRKHEAAPAFLVAGVALWLLGSVGQFCGAVIKSAISRQREYLADASAVQFTRNPTGIADALRVIGGYGPRSSISNPRAHELGHFFFCSAFNGMFATHPPLDERIERLMPSWDGSYIDSTADLELRREGAFDGAHAGVMGFAAGAAQAGTAQTGVSSGESAVANAADEAIAYIQHGNEEQESATLEPEAPVVKDITHLLERVHCAAESQGIYLAFIGSKAIAAGDWPEQLEGLELSQQLDLLRAAIPALKSLEKEEYQAFRKSFMQTINQDKKRSVSEWLAYELFRNPCDVHFNLAKPTKLKYKNVESITSFYQAVLSKFILMGTQDKSLHDQAAKEAWNASGIHTPVREDVTSKEFTDACYELKKCYPLLKPRILKGLLAAANADQIFCEKEQQLIAVLAAIWDLPLPALFESEAS